MQTKTLPAKVRILTKDDGGDGAAAGGGGTPGQFEAIVSVFDNQDSYGDVIRKGAFAKTLDAWQASGLPIPIYYSHRLDDPDMNIGHVVSAAETDVGLQIVGQLDLEMPKAETVHRLFKGGRLSQFSFSYAVPPGGGEVKTDPQTDAEYFELTELDLFEVGPTPVGANSETELLAVKDARHVADHLARRIKQGRVLSENNLSTLRSARDAISTVITAAEGTSDDSGKASNGTGSSKVEDPARGKAEDSDRRALHVIGAQSIPLSTPSDALDALALVDIWSIDNGNNHHNQGAA
jgi:HK97 family phage prohead protease